LCGIIVQITGLGKLNVQGIPSPKVIITLLEGLVISLFGALGEEYGWRGYLLPELTKQYGKVKSTALIGIVWGLYHVPATFLLAQTTGISNPFLICIIQFISVFSLSFPFSYCYYSAGSLVPVIFLHGVWNTVNTSILGDIYKNTSGIITGNLLYINGEGVIGFILSAILIFWFIRQFKKNNAIDLEINVDNVKA
jgi:membrane protease YdiL (CAAX protease family)